MPDRRTWREVRELVQLAAPIAFAQAGQALMGLVDTAVVGRMGAVPLAAVGLSNALFICVLIFGMGLMLGLDPLISQAFGAGDALRARRLLWSGLRLATAVALALSVPLALAPLVLGPAGISSEIASDSSSRSCGTRGGARSDRPARASSGAPIRWRSSS